MRKILAIALMSLTASCFAFGPGRGPGGFGPRNAPIHHVHHGGFWGRGGMNFWPGFVGGAAAGIITGIVAPAPLPPPPPPQVIYPVQQPIVVNPPVVIQQPVLTTPVIYR